ncbi:cytochrome P450 [Mycena olivaceomarginata]|nr:cytochrome P450 [Mycena olivaceomarginata]
MIQLLPQLASSNSTWAVAIFLIVLYGFRWRRSRSQLPLPPGPKKLPIVGNLFNIPPKRQWETYLQWSKQFNSDIIHLNAAGTSVVVLSSMEAVKELFERRSSLYSDRPHLPMLMLMGWDFGIVLQIDPLQIIVSHAARRAHRRILHEAFNIAAVKQFQPQKLAATHRLLRRILQDPRDIMDHFRHMSGALMMDVTYGIDVRSSDDRYISIAEEAMHGFSIASISGAFLVDTIHALRYVPDWVPGAGFKLKAKAWRKAMGAVRTSFTSLNLRSLEELKGNTTVSALGTFVLGMLANPEAQRKAQAEIDSVVGTGQLPDFTDEAALPYVSAIVKEALRWKNVTPIAIPHYLAVEDEYRGYRIPAGSVVVGNAWALLHDETMYSNPEVFRPERFLLDGKLNPAIRDPEMVAFGFGRRICPGRHMATSILWITIASILSTFDIRKAIGKDGEVVEPTYEYFPGLVSSPLPFECSITPRSSQAVEAIQATSS